MVILRLHAYAHSHTTLAVIIDNYVVKSVDVWQKRVSRPELLSNTAKPVCRHGELRGSCADADHWGHINGDMS